jgi:hypothetical protein
MVDLSQVGCGECVFPDLESPGFCMGERAMEGGTLGALFFRGSDCAVEVPDEVRARACCDAPERFDCRGWPYPQDSQIGQACSVHHDCEPGLVCKQASTGLGTCSCPELTPSLPRSAADCSDFILVF